MSNSILQQIDQIDRQLADLRMAIKEEQARASAGPVKDPNAIPVMLTIGQAADKTGLSYDFLRKLCLQGKISFVRVGSKYLINQEKLVSFLNGEMAGICAGAKEGVR